MRGEKETLTEKITNGKGSPPRARGKVQPIYRKELKKGITPACAGKRQSVNSKFRLARDHPRVRGEKVPIACTMASAPGSPPRARGKAVRHDAHGAGRGITPACAGKSSAIKRWDVRFWDHPRVRGEKMPKYKSPDGRVGSPPRARGKGEEISEALA